MHGCSQNKIRGKVPKARQASHQKTSSIRGHTRVLHVAPLMSVRVARFAHCAFLTYVRAYTPEIRWLIYAVSCSILFPLQYSFEWCDPDVWFAQGIQPGFHIPLQPTTAKPPVEGGINLLLSYDLPPQTMFVIGFQSESKLLNTVVGLMAV